MNKADWDTFNGATPINKELLLWFVGNNAPKAAHGVVIGKISAYQPGLVWVDGRYHPLEWYTHWAHVPEGPHSR